VVYFEVTSLHLPGGDTDGRKDGNKQRNGDEETMKAEKEEKL
jgi:hypothetical protein